MGCIAALAGLFFPRIVLIVVWLASDYLEAAYDSVLWPVLGFLFMPLTTLAYAFAWHQGVQGEIGGIGIVAIVIAVLIDLGSWGGGASTRKRKTVVVTKS